MKDAAQAAHDREVYVAYRAALIAALLGAFGFPLDFWVAQDLPHPNPVPPVSASLASAGLAALLFGFRRRVGLRAASLAFCVSGAIVAAGLWFSNQQFAQVPERWVPFQATKLAVLTVALLAPELWAGLFTIGLYTLASVVQWYGFGPEMHTRGAFGEPGAMVAYGAFAAALLVQVRRRYRIERELVRAQRDAEELVRVARLLLAVRDYANTPLQTLVLVMDTLRLKHPGFERELGAASRAVDRMRELNRLLSAIEARAATQPGDESFEAAREIEQVVLPDAPRA
jgi:hypothetical protein